MATILALLTVLQANWPQVLALFSALHVLLGAVNAFIPHDKVPAWFSFIIDHLGALPKPGMKGAMGKWNPPFMGSREIPKATKKSSKKGNKK